MMNHIFRSLELRLTLLVTFFSALVLCVVAMISYVGINQILIIQQDHALTDRIEPVSYTHLTLPTILLV